LVGKELEVIRKRDSRSHEERITQLPDGTRCILPAWMFDEGYCSALPEVESVVIAIISLMQLADLLASQDFEMRSSGHDKTTSSREKFKSARPDRATAVAATRERGSGPAKPSTTVRRVARSIAQRPGHDRRPRRKR
jgi:hypothetical protein